MSGESILVVDDNPLNIKLARTVLLHAGYAVVEAYDALSALKQLELARPRLIIMDLMLPGMDGFELARLLKHDERYRDIPILAMTASGLARDEERSRSVGCESYMTKPFEIEALLREIDDLLN